MTVEKLRAGKWNHQMATTEEVAEKVAEITAIVEKYGFGDTEIHPYSFGIKINDFLRGFKDYGRCTTGSKHQMLAEINGFIPILNHWIEEEEEPKITIRLIRGKHTGEIREVAKSTAEDYIDLEMAEYV